MQRMLAEDLFLFWLSSSFSTLAVAPFLLVFSQLFSPAVMYSRLSLFFFSPFVPFFKDPPFLLSLSLVLSFALSFTSKNLLSLLPHSCSQFSVLLPSLIFLFRLLLYPFSPSTLSKLTFFFTAQPQPLLPPSLALSHEALKLSAAHSVRFL